MSSNCNHPSDIFSVSLVRLSAFSSLTKGKITSENPFESFSVPFSLFISFPSFRNGKYWKWTEWEYVKMWVSSFSFMDPVDLWALLRPFSSTFSDFPPWALRSTHFQSFILALVDKILVASMTIRFFIFLNFISLGIWNVSKVICQLNQSCVLKSNYVNAERAKGQPFLQCTCKMERCPSVFFSLTSCNLRKIKIWFLIEHKTDVRAQSLPVDWCSFERKKWEINPSSKEKWRVQNLTQKWFPTYKFFFVRILAFLLV